MARKTLANQNSGAIQPSWNDARRCQPLNGTRRGGLSVPVHRAEASRVAGRLLKRAQLRFPVVGFSFFVESKDSGHIRIFVKPYSYVHVLPKGVIACR